MWYDLAIGQASAQIPKYRSAMLKSVGRTKETKLVSLYNGAVLKHLFVYLTLDALLVVFKRPFIILGTFV